MIDVKSEMVGTVWKITTEVGAEVEEDDTLIILESMKMEIPIDAPEDGVVREILVKENDVVQEGDVVARIEAS